MQTSQQTCFSNGFRNTGFLSGKIRSGGILRLLGIKSNYAQWLLLCSNRWLGTIIQNGFFCQSFRFGTFILYSEHTSFHFLQTQSIFSPKTATNNDYKSKIDNHSTKSSNKFLTVVTTLVAVKYILPMFKKLLHSYRMTANGRWLANRLFCLIKSVRLITLLRWTLFRYIFDQTVPCLPCFCVSYPSII